MNADWMRTIVGAEGRAEDKLLLRWSDGTEAEVALPKAFTSRAGNPEIGDWGHSVVWPDGGELGADGLWLATLSAIGRSDARQFLEWRIANGLSLTKAAEALGLARRTVAYYSNGARPVPKAILLACTGWDALHPSRKAA